MKQKFDDFIYNNKQEFYTWLDRFGPKNYLDYKFTNYNTKEAYEFAKSAFKKILKAVDTNEIRAEEDKKNNVPLQIVFEGVIIKYDNNIEMPIYINFQNLGDKTHLARHYVMNTKNDLIHHHIIIINVSKKEIFNILNSKTKNLALQKIKDIIIKSEDYIIHELIHVSRTMHEMSRDNLKYVEDYKKYANSKEEVYAHALQFIYLWKKYKGNIPEKELTLLSQYYDSLTFSNRKVFDDIVYKHNIPKVK